MLVVDSRIPPGHLLAKDIPRLVRFNLEQDLDRKPLNSASEHGFVWQFGILGIYDPY